MTSIFCIIFLYIYNEPFNVRRLFLSVTSTSSPPLPAGSPLWAGNFSPLWFFTPRKKHQNCPLGCICTQQHVSEVCFCFNKPVQQVLHHLQQDATGWHTSGRNTWQGKQNMTFHYFKNSGNYHRLYLFLRTPILCIAAESRLPGDTGERAAQQGAPCSGKASLLSPDFLHPAAQEVLSMFS